MNHRQLEYTSLAYVIHVRPYRENSALVDLLTEHHGLIRVVANGLYSSRKKTLAWKGLLRVMHCVDVSFKGQGDLKTLVEVGGDLRQQCIPQGTYLYCAFYMNELITRCVKAQEADETIFLIYQQCLKQLAQETDMQLTLRYFEIQLLEALGYGIDFAYDINGQAIVSKRFYEFIAEEGFSLLESDQMGAFLGEHIIALQSIDLSTIEYRRAAKAILRTALRPHLGNKPLHSKQLFSK